jgi:hypothetical protein
VADRRDGRAGFGRASIEHADAELVVTEIGHLDLPIGAGAFGALVLQHGLDLGGGDADDRRKRFRLREC